MDDNSFGLTWEDATTVVQTEEVIEMENEIIPSQSEEFIGEIPSHAYGHEVVEEVVESEEMVGDEGLVEEEVPDQEVQEVLDDQQDLMYLTDGNVLVMAGDTEETYSQEQLVTVSEEVITDQWGEACPEEIIVGSEEAVTAGGQPPVDEDIPLPTDQDEYTAARPYPCDFCSRRFRKKANLMNHMVAHQTDRPHGCNLCGVRYLRKADLMNHLKSHAFIPDHENNEDLDEKPSFIFLNYFEVEEPSALADHSFDKPRRKPKNVAGRRKKKRTVKEEYENMFGSADSGEGTEYPDYNESDDIKYIEGEIDDQTHYITTHEEVVEESVKYPVTDARKPFVCQHCGVAFAREKALASHSRIHGGDSPFECQTCGEMFWDMALMKEHARTKHGELDDFDDDEDADYSESDDTRYGTFYCATCGLSFHRQDNLKRHQRIHVKEEFINQHSYGHICNVCGESFQEALDLLAHAEVHARSSEYRCMICGEICLDETALADHVQGSHKNLPPHTCVLCGRTCKDGRTLLKHSWEHSKEKSFACSLCNKTFHNKARLKRHMLSHRNKVVSCDVCGEDFPDGRSLMNHRHSHSSVSGRQFPCKECGKTFGSRSSQQIHIRIHTGERPYGCRFCWKAFADGGTLRKHERIHTGEKPYACAVCPRAFNQRVVLREHIRSHHSGPDPKYAHSMTPYCCAVCSDLFATSQDLILHLIHHCDMNTAMKRQPQVGPRKYKRRRKLKPHELDLITDGNQIDDINYGEVNDEETVEQEFDNQVTEEEEEEKEPVRKRSRRTSSRKGSGSSPEKSLSESISDIYNSLNTIESNDSLMLSKSPNSKQKLNKKVKMENSPVASRPKMIHTQKTRVPVEPGEDGRVRHKTRTLVTRTQPADVKSATGDRVRPRTKNVSYHILNPDKLPVATFADTQDQTEEAVENLLKESGTIVASNEEVVEHAPDVASEQIVESEVPVPVGIVHVRTSKRITAREASSKMKNIIALGSKTKVRLVKEGMVISKLKKASGEQNEIEPESILPDVNAVYIKAEIMQNNNADQTEEATTEVVQEELTRALSPESKQSVINIKQELLDPSALHELAEISMRHAHNTTNFYKCEMCEEVFTDRAQLLVHVNVHI